MNPGLVVKLRPAGPWRIGPDSGARNRVDMIYHSDSLYSAVTNAMSRMGLLEAWLDVTARSEAPAVCFSSCFPFVADMAFVVPPRTLWPPTTPAAMSARVRWKSARFIPLPMVESILSGKKLNEHQWSVDGASGCLVAAGTPGPFRTGMRWNAAVDRLSGASERHATACIEFREGCGLWTVVGFRDEAVRDAWQEQVKAAFRLLADSGFGGERSRGWGRAETPEFVAGMLPGLIIEYKRAASPAPPVEEPETEDQPPVTEPPEDEPASAPVPPVEEGSVAAEVAAALEEALRADSEPALAGPVEAAETDASPQGAAPVEGAGANEIAPVEAATETSEAAAVDVESTLPHGRVTDIGADAAEAAPAEAAKDAELPLPDGRVSDMGAGAAEAAPAEAAADAGLTLPHGRVSDTDLPLKEGLEGAAETSEAVPAEEATGLTLPHGRVSDTDLALEEGAVAQETTGTLPAEKSATSEPLPNEAAVRAPRERAPMRVAPELEFAQTAIPSHLKAHWLLSLFTPAASDAVDWGFGNYAVLARGGRIDSPAMGSGELKKQIQMVAEGSVLYSDGAPLGAAADVAPDGFAHPVFRAGFALAIPLPEVH